MLLNFNTISKRNGTSMAKISHSDMDDTISDDYIRAGILSFLSEVHARKGNPVIYANETNGIQALPILLELGIPARFCSIRSTLLERKRVSSMCESLPTDFLLSCAMGDDVLVVDYGARKDRSRAIYQGIPLVKYILDRLWLGMEPEKVMIYPRTNAMTRKNNAVSEFSRWYGELGKSAIRKISAFSEIARRSASDGQLDTAFGIRLSGISASTSHDNDKLFYAATKRRYFEELGRRALRLA